MRFRVNDPLVNYAGQVFTRPVQNPDGTQVLDDKGAPVQEPLLIKNVLATACLSADGPQYANGVQKMVVFNLLMKINQAINIVDLSSEEVSILRDLVGRQLSVAAVGAVYAILDDPIPTARAEKDA